MVLQGAQAAVSFVWFIIEGIGLSRSLYSLLYNTARIRIRYWFCVELKHGTSGTCSTPTPGLDMVHVFHQFYLSEFNGIRQDYIIEGALVNMTGCISFLLFYHLPFLKALVCKGNSGPPTPSPSPTLALLNNVHGMHVCVCVCPFWSFLGLVTSPRCPDEFKLNLLPLISR